MLPNNVVSFMKKIVKNDSSQQENTNMVTPTKLTRLKQTLTTGLQQAQDSVAKFSPKSMHVGVGDMASRRLSSKEPSNEESVLSTDSNLLDKDASNPTNLSSAALLNTSVGTSSNKTCSGPPNRLTSCRVCVRSLSIGNSDVSFRLCSQCNLKVCEDCASYSNLDNDIDKNFWRCSVCRRRNQGATTPLSTSTAGAAGTGVTRQQPISAHRNWSEEKPSSVSTSSSDDYNKRSREARNAQTPGSAPVSRRERRSTSGESSSNIDHKSLATSQQTDLSRPSYGNSIDNMETFNGTRSGEGNRRSSRKANRLDQPQETTRSISASESSPEDMTEQQKITSRKSTIDIQFSESSRRSSCRQSFQKQMRDQSVYLSADDASSASRWSQQQRRYSSESSDASETSGAPGTPRRPSQEEIDEAGYGSSLVPSSRRRLSFRSNRTRHFYGDVVDDSYEAEEQSAPDLMSANTSLTANVSRLSRRSCSDISQLNNSSELTAAVASAVIGSQHGLHSPRGSIYDGSNDERLASHRKVSTQLSDPPPSLSRAQSPRPSIASSSRSGSDRRSVEREAIRIVIDDVDCSPASQTINKTLPQSSSTILAYLLRDSNYNVGHGFTAGFGLTLASKKNVLITWIEPHGPADRAGLRCGDIVLSWDGVELVGRNFEDVQQELQHSGDSIQIQVLRNSHLDDTLHSQQPNSHDESQQQPLRPNKLTSSVLVLDAGSSGRSTPPSPTRRRLPQAPVASIKADPVTCAIYRLQLKFKCSVERNGNICMVITVLGAEKSLMDEYNEENSFGWIQMVLTLPSGASRKFVTDRTEATYGLRWNSFFTCSDMTTEEVSRSQLTMSLWIDYFQRGETKLAESTLDLQNLVMDGRPTWFPLRNCDASVFAPPRRLSKTMSHDLQNHPQQHQPLYNLSISRNSSELSVDHTSLSPPSLNQRTPSPPGLPRSRSAEICNLLLQPEAPGWSNSGLSAPASLAPSRRGSSYNCDEELQIPQSSPTSRRGSSVFANENEMANIQLVHEKLSSCSPQTANLQQHGFSSSSQLKSHRSQSFRTDIKHNQHSSHDLPSNRISERILNSSSLELGAGQILPGRKTLGRDESSFYSTESCGQVKLGLIITQGQLEVEVIGARNLPMVGENNVPPDTYVKATLCDQQRVFCKRKTRTMRQTCHPEFHQTLLFEACNALGATLVIEVRLKDGIGSGKSIRRPSTISPACNTMHMSSHQNQSTLGLVHVALDRLALSTLTISWYRLIPISLINMTDMFHFDESP